MDFGARAPYGSPVGPLGSGVDLRSIGRIRDDFLHRRVRVAGAEHGLQQARADVLGRTEGILGEPDSGISGELSGVWDAFEDFSVDPSDGAARRQVVAALESFTARIRTVERGWRDLESDSAARLGAAVTEANDLLARVAQLNGTIAVAGARGAPPADLLDERDVLLDELSVGFGVGVTRNTDGTVSVSLADENGASVDLVTGTTAATLAVGGAPEYALTASSGGTATTLGTPRGEFGGLRTYLTDTTSGLPRPAPRSTTS